MHLASARAILATPAGRSAHAAIADCDDLLWAEHGDEVEQWNALAAANGWGSISVRATDGANGEQRFFYTYQGREAECPFEWDRMDNLRSVHFIAGLVAQEAGLRACNDLAGNSEWGFIALAPAQWETLEREFGAAALARRFTPAQGSYDAFCDAYFTDLHMYGEEEVAVPEPKVASLDELMSRIHARGLDIGYNLTASYTLAMEKNLNVLLVSATRRGCAALMSHATFGTEVTALCQDLCAHLGYRLQCIALLSQEELDLDSAGAWTFGWMVPGACLQFYGESPAAGVGVQERREGAAVGWLARVAAFFRKRS